ncbi:MULTISPECIES: cation transporter [Paraburkholderia]|uniref:Cation transporter n=1 Tax=Paraburkholderia podalyriae TaxID=1938811 RepID=A0ABR7PYM6_9BURK|nr:cation transporter [Paraburkholderia podalyriae]MBC8751397.1 cation transporter [Paraburkholderia podalyriae]
MSCDCGSASARNSEERRTLRIALVLNATMFVVGMLAGWRAESSGVIADALDMLADASAYGLALMAVTRGARFKQYSARWTGGTLLLLSVGIVVDVARRFFIGSEPLGFVIIAYSLLSLATNVAVLALLAKHRSGEVHLRASWICTRTDVIANVGVLTSGIVVFATGWRYADLAVGLAMGLYVAKEAAEIWEQAHSAAQTQSATG